MNKNYDLLEIHTDGGSRGNPGPAAIGVVAENGNDIVFEISEKIGDTTNNVAEYTAVLRAFQMIDELKLNIGKIRFVLDSELIVRQLTGIYKIKQPHLILLQKEIKELANKLRDQKVITQVVFVNVKRELNKEADKLVNDALDAR